jgi:hypothetical protein
VVVVAVLHATVVPEGTCHEVVVEKPLDGVDPFPVEGTVHEDSS